MILMIVLMLKNIDIWGYYNGCENRYNQSISGADNKYFASNRTLLHTPNGFSLNETIPEKLQLFKGADRTVNSSFAMGGVLTSITYPPGGKTTFTYESNDVNNFHIYSSTVTSSLERHNVINNGNPTYSKTSKTFMIEEPVKAKISIYISIKDYHQQMSSFYVTLRTESFVKTYGILSDQEK